MGIMRTSLDPSLQAWIMDVTGLGPGIGQVRYIVKPNSTHYAWLRDDLKIPPHLIHFDVDSAHANMTANRNDVALIFTGKYTGTGAAPYAWTKDETHLIGVGPPQRHEYAGRGVIIRTLSTAGVFAMKNTGDLCQFHNIAFQQWGQNAAALTAFRESGHMNQYKGCHFFGQIRTEVKALTTSSSLEIDSTTVRSGSGNLYERCVIGGSGGTKRTGANGTLLITSGGAIGVGADMQFRDCQFMSWMEDVDPSAVLLAANYAGDRLLLFEGCTFYNFVENHGGTIPAYVFRDSNATTHDILLKRCARLGFTAWTSDQTFCFSADSIGATDGGQSTAADES